MNNNGNHISKRRKSRILIWQNSGKSQACERLMETFYESVESDGEYSGEVLPPEKFAKALFDAYKNKDLTAFLLAICQHSMFDLLRNAYLVPFRFNADGHTNPYILTDGSGNLLMIARKLYLTKCIINSKKSTHKMMMWKCIWQKDIEKGIVMMKWLWK